MEGFPAILSHAMYVDTVDTSCKISKSFNAMYVDAVNAKDIYSTHISVHNFLNILPIFNLKKVLENWDPGPFNYTSKCYVCWHCQHKS